MTPARLAERPNGRARDQRPMTADHWQSAFARSRERFERILKCAAALMAEKGSEAFRMRDIVERTGMPFGPLYQYFPDKTAIIGTLAERYKRSAARAYKRNWKQ
jgi:AcrR family transcriptional regulator